MPSTSCSTCARPSPGATTRDRLRGRSPGEDLARSRLSGRGRGGDRVRTSPAPRTRAPRWSRSSRPPGHILAMAGGKDFGTSQLNLATFKGGTGRQAGSAFKAFTLAEAMEQGFDLNSQWYGPNTITIDDPVCAGPEGPWEPENAEGGGSSYSLQSATAHSVNTVFAQLVVEVGPDEVVDMAHRLGIRSDLPAVCAITLGSVAVNPVEMTNAYATLAARGMRHRANPLLQVRSPGGRIDPRIVPKGKRVVEENVADLVTYALEDVVEFGTGASAKLSSWPAAGKTGTAQDNVDAWFCGYTVQIATCVWVGFPKGQIPLENIEGVSAGLRRHDPGRDLARLHGGRDGGQECGCVPGAVVRPADRDAVGGSPDPAAAGPEPGAQSFAERGAIAVADAAAPFAPTAVSDVAADAESRRPAGSAGQRAGRRPGRLGEPSLASGGRIDRQRGHDRRAASRVGADRRTCRSPARRARASRRVPRGPGGGTPGSSHCRILGRRPRPRRGATWRSSRRRRPLGRRERAWRHW